LRTALPSRPEAPVTKTVLLGVDMTGDAGAIGEETNAK
jgi:hypothetical protein